MKHKLASASFDLLTVGPYIVFRIIPHGADRIIQPDKINREISDLDPLVIDRILTVIGKVKQLAELLCPAQTVHQHVVGAKRAARQAVTVNADCA